MLSNVNGCCSSVSLKICKYGKGSVNCEKQTKRGEDAKSSNIGDEVIYIVRREHKVVKNSGRVGNQRTKEMGFF